MLEHELASIIICAICFPPSHVCIIGGIFYFYRLLSSQVKLGVGRPHRFPNSSWNLRLSLFVEYHVVLSVLNLAVYLLCLFQKELL